MILIFADWTRHPHSGSHWPGQGCCFNELQEAATPTTGGSLDIPEAQSPGQQQAEAVAVAASTRAIGESTALLETSAADLHHAPSQQAGAGLATPGDGHVQVVLQTSHGRAEQPVEVQLLVKCPGESLSGSATPSHEKPAGQGALATSIIGLVWSTWAKAASASNAALASAPALPQVPFTPAWPSHLRPHATAGSSAITQSSHCSSAAQHVAVSLQVVQAALDASAADASHQSELVRLRLQLTDPPAGQAACQQGSDSSAADHRVASWVRLLAQRGLDAASNQLPDSFRLQSQTSEDDMALSWGIGSHQQPLAAAAAAASQKEAARSVTHSEAEQLHIGVDLTDQLCGVTQVCISAHFRSGMASCLTCQLSHVNWLPACAGMAVWKPLCKVNKLCSAVWFQYRCLDPDQILINVVLPLAALSFGHVSLLPTFSVQLYYISCH